MSAAGKAKPSLGPKGAAPRDLERTTHRRFEGDRRPKESDQ